MNDFGTIKIETNTKISFLYFPFLALICYKLPLPFFGVGGGVVVEVSTFWQIFYFKMHPTYNRQAQVVLLRLWFPLQRLSQQWDTNAWHFLMVGEKRNSVWKTADDSLHTCKTYVLFICRSAFSMLNRPLTISFQYVYQALNYWASSHLFPVIYIHVCIMYL